MTNFDYYNSVKRKTFLKRKSIFANSIFDIFFFFILILLIIFFIISGLYPLANITIGFLLLMFFWIISLKYAKPFKKSCNLADELSFELFEVFESAKNEASQKNAQITTELLFENMSNSKIGGIIFTRLGLFYPVKKINTIKNVKPQISQEIVQIIESFSQDEIDLGDFLLKLIKNNPSFREYLNQFNITYDDLEKVVEWAKKIIQYSKPKRFWQRSIGSAGIGQEWAYGYAPTLSLFSIDLARYFDNSDYEINIFSREPLLKEIQTILAKSDKNNCLLIGEPGIGKKTIINALAQKVSSGDCMEELKYYRIRKIDIGRLLAGASKEELNARIMYIFSEAVHAGDIILYIENFQSLISGNVDVSQVLIPYLQNSKLKIIASVSPAEYAQDIRYISEIAESFDKIEIHPTEPQETLSILLQHVLEAEYRNNVFFPVSALKKIIELSDRYIHEIPQPENAIRLLSETATNFATGKLMVVMAEDIEKLVSQKVSIPIGEVSSGERDKLLDMEKYLHQKVIGQDEAITAISNTLRRVRAGLTTGKRPIGVFLFLGPTGVGKTETAKTLAETYYGKASNMIRLDMSEYNSSDATSKLLGTTNNPTGILTNAVLKNPYSLILLDEIEKAGKDVLNLFLQIFEDGRLTDPIGRVSDFTNTIIIATSNAESKFIQEKVQLGEITNLKEELTNKLIENNIFSPEFINRFDSVIFFKPLSTEQLNQVANLMIEDINRNLENKHIKINVNPDALTKLIQLGYDPKFGARPLRRVMQEKIENLLAKKMLSGEIKEGQVLQISLEDIN